MNNILKKNFVSINGILAIVFGLVALFFPGLTLATLGILFSIAILVGGIMLIAGSLRIRKINHRWYILLLEGIIGILVGIIILARPELVATVFVTIIGIWALIIGLVFLFTYIKSRLPSFSNTFMLIISILSLITGIFIIIDPFESTRIITILIGIYAIIYGLFSVIHSSRIYRIY
jgi:uncharacterized membrane protein HdeD (DUF308 family)